MRVLNLQIEDSFFPHFKAMLDSFIKDKKVTILEEDFGDDYPQSVVLGSVEEIRKRAYNAENRIKNGEGIYQEEYDETMNKFFKEEIGIDR